MTARLPDSAFNNAKALEHVTRAWNGSIVQRLSDYIAVPAKSPMFDADWFAHGYLESVVRHTAQWIEEQKVEGLSLEVVRLPGRTPVLFFDVAATRSAGEGVSEQTVLMYGHLDKQPEFSGWRKDLGPGRPSTRTESFTDGAAPMTAMRLMRRLPRLRHSRSKKSGIRASLV